MEEYFLRVPFGCLGSWSKYRRFGIYNHQAYLWRLLSVCHNDHHNNNSDNNSNTSSSSSMITIATKTTSIIIMIVIIIIRIIIIIIIMSILIFIFFHTCKVLNSESLLLSKQVMVDDGFENSLYNVYCHWVVGTMYKFILIIKHFLCYALSFNSS